MRNGANEGLSPGAPDPGPNLTRPGKDAIPTIALLLGITILLGAITGWFLSSRGQPSEPEVAMIAPDERPEALNTLTGDMQLKARADSRQCSYPMGFVSISTPGNPAGGTVSIRTSRYTSPKFHVSEVPQRIAIPNPLPQTGGIDTFSVDGDAKGLIVSLFPTAWMEPVNGSKTISVRWHPGPPCK
jgi:hypothetical protein